MHDTNERLRLLEEHERTELRNLLVEERTRICLFGNSLAPVLVSDLPAAGPVHLIGFARLEKHFAIKCSRPASNDAKQLGQTPR